MDKLILVTLLSCLSLASLPAKVVGDGLGSYAVVLPDVIRPGHPLDASVQILTTSEPVDVTVQVFTNDRDVENTVAEQTASIINQGLLSVQIPSTADAGQYQVRVSGQGPIRFIKETMISTSFKTQSILIQTDKGIYKPGALVRYRVMSVYPSLQLYEGTFNITIIDPNQSKIRQFLSVQGDHNVYTGSIQLSDKPVLGDWSIHVQTETGEEKTLSLKVDEYVLPKFEVITNYPKFILAETSELVISVTAKYTYGKFVKARGEITLELQPLSDSEKELYGFRPVVRYVEMAAGVAEVRLTREELLFMAGSKTCTEPMCFSNDENFALYAQVNSVLLYRKIHISATVTEDLTGNSYTSNGTVDVVKDQFVVEFLSFSPETFKPGLHYSAFTQVKKADGSNPALSDLANYRGDPVDLIVKVTCSSQYSYGLMKSTSNYSMDITGLVEIRFVPNITATYCDIEVKFKYVTETKRIDKFLSESEEGIQISVPELTGSIQCETSVMFEVTSTDSISGFFYQILSKGNIAKQGHIETAREDRTHGISVVFDRDLCRNTAPSARILVWYVTGSGEVIVDSIDVNVEFVYGFDMSVEFSTDETRPGNNMSFTVNSHPDSLVCVLAVDQSVLLLGGSNDITTNQIKKELAMYDSSSESGNSGGGGGGRVFFDIWWPVPNGGKDTKTMLENAGVHLLTDALVYEEITSYPYNYYMFEEMRPVDGMEADYARGPVGAPGQAATMLPSTSTTMMMGTTTEEGQTSVDGPLKDPARIRTEFPETWLWFEEVVGADGQLHVETQVPDTITSWVASSFAVHSEEGLSVAQTAARLNAMKPFFVSLNLPYSIIRGEEVALEATVFNYMTSSIAVVVSLEASPQFGVRDMATEELFRNADVTKTVRVPAGDGVLVSFWIVPEVLGQIRLCVKAQSTVAADAVCRQLLVEDIGIQCKPETQNKSIGTRKGFGKRTKAIQCVTVTCDAATQCTRLKPRNTTVSDSEESDDEKDDEKDQTWEPEDKESIMESEGEDELFEEDDEFVHVKENLSNDKPVHEDRKFIVFESQLFLLFSTCFVCLHKPCQVIMQYTKGSFAAIEQRCKKGHSKTWFTQPLHGTMPQGNLQMAAGILFSGSSPVKVINMFRHMNMLTIAYRTFNMLQSHYLLPAVYHVWKNEQQKVLDDIITSGRKVKLGGDARCDSPGHCAKYGSYTIMDMETSKILDMQLIQPEGERQYHTYNKMIKLLDTDFSYIESLSAEYPQNVVQDSQRVVFTVVGDVMGPAVNNLDSLLAMPYGCGEQNMIKFAPNIYIMDYLQETGQLTREIEAKAIGYMESGYMRELTYQRRDGSFSAFGDSDSSGSMWLTAFVIRCFHQAKPFIFIDQNVIDRAVNFISQHQDQSGAFNEPGNVIHEELQGGSAHGLGLTAYVLQTLLENEDDISDPRIRSAATSAIRDAVIHVEGQLSSINTDPYALSLVTYALVLADRPSADTALQTLEGLAKYEGSKRWWEKETEEEEGPVVSPPWYYRVAPSFNIEMTAYALLIYTEKRMIVEGAPVVSWLAEQTNSQGGFRSTQDTVIGLQALSGFESIVGRSSDESIGIEINVDGTVFQFNPITPVNSMIMQSYELPSEISNVNVTAVGTGIALFQMTIYYHTSDKETYGGITLTVDSETTESGNVIISACGRWISTGTSGMVVLQIKELTGFHILEDDLLSTYAEMGLKMVEKVGNTLNLYLDGYPSDSDLCLSVTSVNVNPVANIQEALVSAYAYYNPANRNSAFYKPSALTGKVMCGACPECCTGTQVPDINNCEDNPCENGARCVDDMNTYYCQCTVGYSGRNCHIRTQSSGGESLIGSAGALVFLHIIWSGWILLTR